MKVTRRTRKKSVQVLADATGLVSHAGSALLSALSDRLGLTAGLSGALADTRSRRSAHDPGRVLRDLAVMLADGGDCLSDLGALRDQPDLFGRVASDATAWRVIDALDADRLEDVRAARARARARAWAAGPGRMRSCSTSTRRSSRRTRTRRAPRPPTSAATASTPSSATWRARPWPGSCAPGTPAPTAPPITSRCSWTGSTSSPRRSARIPGPRSWCAPTRPAARTSSSTRWSRWSFRSR